jgi:hypothetical protein
MPAIAFAQRHCLTQPGQARVAVAINPGNAQF